MGIIVERLERAFIHSSYTHIIQTYIDVLSVSVGLYLLDALYTHLILEMTWEHDFFSDIDIDTF